MKDITVQIKVHEHDENYFLLKGNHAFHLINRSDCTVIADPVDSVQPAPSFHVDLSNMKVSGGENESLDYLYLKSNASPKLIAKAGEWVKIVGSDFELQDFTLNKPYQLKEDLFDRGYYKDNNGHFRVIADDNGIENGYSESFAHRSLKFEVCPAPVQRKSLGFYEGTEIFDDTKAWFINYESLKIVEMKDIVTIENFTSELFGCSKVYLDPKEVNARLKKEVEKKAMDYKFSISECVEATQHSTPFAYAIQQLEKEFGVTYLTE